MSVKKEIRVPNMGGASEVEILEIFVSSGSAVAKEDPLLSLETDKAVMDVPCPEEGVIDSLTVKVGDSISEGDIIAYLTSQSSSEEKPEKSPKKESGSKAGKDERKKDDSPDVPASESRVQDAPAESSGKDPSDKSGKSPEKSPASASGAGSGSKSYHASPSVRKFARELGADLSQVAGTAPKGRITKEDVQLWIKNRLGSSVSGGISRGLPDISAETFTPYGPVDEEKLSRIRKITGSRLQASWQNIPHVTHFDEADITELEEFRKDLNGQLKNEGLKITPLAFIIKAAVKALQEFPRFNSSLSNGGDRLFLKHYYHIGFAAETPQGLMVPVIQDVDQKGIREIARELIETSGKVRENKLSSDKLKGSTFTISSLGGIGGTQFTPVINPPEAAILGVSRSQWKPVWNGETFVPRRILPFSLSYDHRIIDGAEAARFCSLIADILTDFRLSAI